MKEKIKSFLFFYKISNPHLRAGIDIFRLSDNVLGGDIEYFDLSNNIDFILFFSDRKLYYSKL